MVDQGSCTVRGAVVTLALVLGVGTMAVAAYPGCPPLKLGTSNTIDYMSTLIGSASGSLLRIEKEGRGTALDLRVKSAKPR